jgi:hypothetical protein
MVKNIFFEKKFLVVCKYAQMHQNTFLTTPDVQKYLFLKKSFWWHFRILPDRQNLFFKRDIFDRLEWLKTCFDAFSHTPRLPETFFQKRYFLPSGVVKDGF